jgi:hypothetical protein
MTLQNAPPGLDYERDKRFSKVYSIYSAHFMKHRFYINICFFFVVFQGFGCNMLSKGSSETPFFRKALETFFL